MTIVSFVSCLPLLKEPLSNFLYAWVGYIAVRTLKCSQLHTMCLKMKTFERKERGSALGGIFRQFYETHHDRV